jgi:hypothetical protein
MSWSKGMPGLDYFATALWAKGATCASSEGMESCEEFFQLRQANPKQTTLPTAASAIAMVPKLSKNIKAAGMNTTATIRKATVVVYPVPVDF